MGTIPDCECTAQHLQLERAWVQDLHMMYPVPYEYSSALQLWYGLNAHYILL